MSLAPETGSRLILSRHRSTSGKETVSVILISIKTSGILLSDNQGLILDLRFGSCWPVLMQDTLVLNVTSVQRGWLISATVLCSRASERMQTECIPGYPQLRGRNQYRERLLGLLRSRVMYLHSNFNSFSLCRPNPWNQEASLWLCINQSLKKWRSCDRWGDKHPHGQKGSNSCYFFFVVVLVVKCFFFFIGVASQREQSN